MGNPCLIIKSKKSLNKIIVIERLHIFIGGFMRRFFLLVLALLFLASVAFSSPAVSLDIYNQGYAYNDEDGDYQDQAYTMETLRYVEDLFQPSFRFTFSDNFEFSAGCGFLIPFDYTEKISAYYPYIQMKFSLNGWRFIIGSLDDEHNMAPFMLDPLDQLIVSNRVWLTNTQEYYFHNGNGPIPNIYPVNSMGFYQYGAQLQYNDDHQKLDIYWNWQYQCTADYRERFDIGISYNYELLYAAAHYWHNGGHQFIYAIDVTENDNVAFGLRNKTFSLLYTASDWSPNRDVASLDVFGQGIYGEYNFTLWGITFTPQLFFSDAWINPNDAYISVEGDPFYKCPFYAGFNVHYTIEVMKDVSLILGLVNGTYLPYTTATWSYLMIRYDQEIDAQMKFSFDLVTQS